MKKSDTEWATVRAHKAMAIGKLGGKCMQCGISDCRILEFHHSKGGKEKNLSAIMGGRWSLIEKEIAKCTLLCGNCHMNLHFKDPNTKCARIKRKMLDVVGAKCCTRCSHVGFASLDFHHLRDKRFALGLAYSKPWGETLMELEKCIVLCRNCHILEHFDADKFTRLRLEVEKRIGQKEKNAPLKPQLVWDLYEKGMRQIDIARKFGYAKSTICKIIREGP